MFGDLIKIFYVFEKDKADGKAIWQDRGFLGLVVGLLAVLLGKYLHINLDADLQGALVVVIAGIFHLTQAHIGGLLGSVTIGKKAPQAAKPAQPKAEEHNPINLSCFVFFLVLAMASPAPAQHLNCADTGTTVSYFNIVSGNALCTGANEPVSGCTGVGNGSLTALPSTIPSNNIAAIGSSGAWTGSVSLAALPVGTYETACVACIAASSTNTGACSANSVPLSFSVPTVPPIPTQTLGP